ncbi:glycosyltransferase family 2 protein [Anaerocolumna sp. AGMB13025]|uniref:glycosyltransferase family 2 protein n=1 Tax=Anaerocolumna sp. AGMB13025 TaxID=3039116 RepID=UPI00241E2EC3|nr:glycosyltransferase family 2 protein [Anaerocolumna sp. AGMB13025]WFR59527.1 glycosyltransferase family 2 protein [Anaerocolumna sp. AGMB13025]
MDKISVVVPCYNEEKVISLFYREMKFVMDKMDYVEFEIILIDDGSRDKTLQIMKRLQAKDERVKYLSFSKNFGKEAAIFAGLENCTGDFAVMMDADLQDPPRLLEEMYHCLKSEGYDSVATRRVTRDGEPKLRSFFAKRFYHLMNRISKTDIVDGARDYRLMNRQMVDAIIEMKEYNRFSKGIFGWVGFKTKWLEYDNVARAAGETKWSFRKLLFYSFDGIVAFSTMPLGIASFSGLFLCVLSFISIIIIMIRYLIGVKSAHGWSSMTCIILFVSGFQLFCMGVLGQYLAKTYLEVKKRPIYIVKEKCL